jgi:phenylacetate-CoA ligase
MAINNFISENIILLLSDMVTGQSIYKHLKLLNKSQFWTRKQIDDYQNEKLRKLIRHAYNNVPYYRDLFLELKLRPEDIQTKNDLEKLPIVTKEELKKNKDKHLAVNLKKEDLIFSSSSGSTGEPFQFYQTKQSESFLKAAAIRAWSWMGYRLGDKYVKVSMNPRLSFVKKMQDKMNNCLYLSSIQLTPLEFQKIEKKIINFNPLFIRCYPVPLQFLAQQIIEISNKYQGKSLKAINTTGSTLHDDIRNKIENVFNVKIFDSYSCEGGTVFSECPAHVNYHPAEEYAISEFIADSYTNSDNDKPLRHITTDLHNYASPFIRYDTQDYLVFGAQKLCDCGRHFLNVNKIKGRDSDILKTPSGKLLIVENFVAYFEWINEVDQIQVVQEQLNKIIIKMIVNNNFNNDVRQKIQLYWNEYIGNDVNVIIELVDEIKLTPSGKRKTVIRNPKITLND